MKIKRLISVLMLSSLMLVGCGDASSNNTSSENITAKLKTTNNTQSITDVLDSQVQAQQQATLPTVAVEPKTQTATNQITYSANEIAYDLSVMSSDMIYSSLYSMTTNPYDFMDKVIKVKGFFTVYKDATTGKTYFSVMSQDITACCSQGIEFVWGDGSYNYPNDYPAEGQDIIVTGVLDTYEENGYYYLQLKNAEVTF